MTAALIVRDCSDAALPAMTALINAIIAIGGTTAYRAPLDPARVEAHFRRPRLPISCVGAWDADALLGFQSLRWADPEHPGDAATPAGYAVIASYVSPAAQSRGAGRALFGETARRARTAGASHIDATILKINGGGLAYYGRMGFEDYRESPDAISKRYAVV